MTRSLWFWNQIAKGYAKNPVGDPAAYEQKLEMTRMLLKPDMKVFEYGCGTGTTALIHAPHVAHIQAIDYSAKMIAIARGKAEAAGVSNVSFDVATIENWVAEDASYDMIQAHSILHLVLDLDAVLARTRSLIKPGGVFVSSTVCFREESLLSRLLVPFGSALRILPYIGPFDGEQLLEAIKRAGFEIEHQWRPRPTGSIFVIACAV